MNHNTVKHHVGKAMVLFLCGGAVYAAIELLWRGHTHWTMFCLGGALFLVIGAMNEFIPWEVPLILQGLAGAALVTVAEFLTGCVLNLWLGLGIWDYSSMPFNLLGQVCLPFSLAWFALSAVAVILDDWLRFFLFGEERPHYTLI